MRSRAVAGVDSWLKQAEEVLSSQREQSISPSFATVWDAGEVQQTIAMTEFAPGIEGVLKVLCERPGRWILVIEFGPDRYWQALAFEDGSLVVEVISNHWIEGELRWRPEQEEHLRDLGWTDPDPHRKSNWSRLEPTTSPDVSGVAQQAAETLSRVFGVGPHDKLEVKLFSSQNRGGSPASPIYVE